MTLCVAFLNEDDAGERGRRRGHASQTCVIQTSEQKQTRTRHIPSDANRFNLIILSFHF